MTPIHKKPITARAHGSSARVRSANGKAKNQTLAAVPLGALWAEKLGPLRAEKVGNLHVPKRKAAPISRDQVIRVDYHEEPRKPRTIEVKVTGEKIKVPIKRK